MKKFIIFFLFCFISFSYAEDVKYTTHIKPIFESKCAGCHNGLEYEEWKAAVSKDPNMKKDMVGMKMDTFRSLIAYVTWPNTGALMRRLDNGANVKDGKPGNMYEYLGDTKEEREKNLEVFKKWVPVWKLGRINELSLNEILEQNKIKDRY
ncbi:MAG: hypothetical protein LDL13_02970 [Calditerrivibrio sp.]|nr:hypothetical protein [Calditerrivibrio sp.]